MSDTRFGTEKSLGLARGKNDKIDSFRISQYGQEKLKRLTPEKPLDNNILVLRQLLAFRKRVVRDSAGLSATVKERKHIYHVGKTDPIINVATKQIQSNKNHIKQIEKEIIGIIKNSEAMLKTYQILTSIRGIGPINALMTIAYTENFTSFSNARKYAVYVGVVPFENTSGTSIKGKMRVSILANRELKQELGQAAKVAIAHDPEIRAHAARKLENKSWPVVINNVKFKLIMRMFSLVKRGEMYSDNYKRIA